MINIRPDLTLYDKLSHMSRYNIQDDDDINIGGSGFFRIPDRDVYRRTLTSFGTVHTYFHNRLQGRTFKDRIILQPHYSSLQNIVAPFGSTAQPADGVCSYFLRRGLIKPNKTQMTTAVWSADARWLVLGTVSGNIALWEGDTLKVHKVVDILAHVTYDGEKKIEGFAITAMAWSHHRNLLVSGDERGLIQYCDETFREVRTIPEAHSGAIRGLSYSCLDSKLVSCSDDSMLHIWTVGMGYDKPDMTLKGHVSDVKCVEWHPYRSLIASGSRDSTLRLWDPRTNAAVSNLTGHKKQVNCCSWSENGNWLASGSKDGLIKIYDIRTLREVELLRGHNSDVCSLAWHPHHDTLLLSGGYNGSLIYWLAGHNQAAHTVLVDAHRQSVDAIAWHPAGHCVGTASHDGILKFWCRAPPGGKLEPDVRDFQDAPTVAYGPLAVGQPAVLPAPVAVAASSSSFAAASSYQSSKRGSDSNQHRFSQRGQGDAGSTGTAGRKRPRDY